MGILEATEDIPSASVVLSTSAPIMVEAKVLEEAANGFSVLDIEESSEHGDSEDGKTVKTYASLGTKEFEYELDDELDDEIDANFLTCFCLLEDLKNIRDFLSLTWADYQGGNVDLMSASVTTDVALSLAKQAIEQAEKMKGFPKGKRNSK